MEKQNIRIVAFYPPKPGFETPEQYALMKEAGFDAAEMCCWEWVSKEFMLRSLKSAEENGIKLTASDTRFCNWTEKSDGEIRGLVQEYKDIPNVYGYYIQDEPRNANPLARVYRTMLEEDPEREPQLNFLPQWAVPEYDGHVTDLMAVLGPGVLKVLSFDQYPFSWGGVFGAETAFQNFETIWKYGKDYGADTAFYIQAVSILNGFRTSAEVVKYHVSIGAAYGFKEFKYFTWFTPISDAESFVPGTAIMTADGKKGELFDAAKEVNRSLKKIGNYLGACHAEEVYHTGEEIPNCARPLPSQFFFQVRKGNAIVSLLKERENGRNYLLVVNKDYQADCEMEFQLQTGIGLKEVTSGFPVEVAMDDGCFKTEFHGGEFHMYQLPVGFDFTPETEESDDLALGKPVYASSSIGEKGMYAKNITDGQKETAWKPAEEADRHFVLIDLLKTKRFDRIQCFPGNDGGKVTGCSVFYSQDLQEWKRIAEIPMVDGNEILLPETEARYVKFEFTCSRNDLSISSIQIYLGEHEDWRKKEDLTDKVYADLDFRNKSVYQMQVAGVHVQGAIESAGENGFYLENAESGAELGVSFPEAVKAGIMCEMEHKNCGDNEFSLSMQSDQEEFLIQLKGKKLLLSGGISADITEEKSKDGFSFIKLRMDFERGRVTVMDSEEKVLAEAALTLTSANGLKVTYEAGYQGYMKKIKLYRIVF